MKHRMPDRPKLDRYTQIGTIVIAVFCLLGFAAIAFITLARILGFPL